MLALLLSAPAYAVTICENGEHIFSVELVLAATGDTDGLRRYTCDICGYSYDEVIPATGHHWGEWITDVEPDCTETGHRHCVCEECGAEKNEELPALGHDYVREETPPDCTESGIITFTCSRCGDSFTETGAPATGHNYLPGQAQNAEAGKDGWQEYICTDCGDSYRVVIPALPEEIVLPLNPQAPATMEPEASAPVEPVPAESVPTVAPVSVAPQARDAEPASEFAEPADTDAFEPTPESRANGGFNAMDVVLACGIAATAAGFSLLSAPYIKVLSWGKKKKREIDLRRKEQ